MTSSSLITTGPIQHPSPPHPRPRTHYSGIIHTGQSLSDGVAGDITSPLPVLPYALKLHDTSSKPWDLETNSKEVKGLQLVELSEPIRPTKRGAQQWPDNIEGVTPAEEFARQVETLRQNRVGEDNSREPRGEGIDEEVNLVTVHSVVGRAGEGMAGIKKGGSINAYEASMWEARGIARLLNTTDTNTKIDTTSLSYDAILLTHGETDAWQGHSNSVYLHDLNALQHSYAADLASITGQTHEPVMLLTQQCTVPPVAGMIAPLTQMQWRVQEQSGGKVICVGPKYHMGYSADKLHMPAGGYRRLGEKMAQAYGEVVQKGGTWTPLRPKGLQRRRNVIRVGMEVRSPPLRWDGNLPVPHQEGRFAAWKTGRGFEVRDGQGGIVGIEKVEIGEDGVSVEVYLRKPVPDLDTKLSLAYAMTPDGDGFTGCMSTGRIGHLCDSDPFPSASPISIEVDLVHDSRKFSGGGDEMLALYDRITPGEYVLTGFDDQKPDRGTLSRAWEGETGRQRLTFRHNHSNFCVQFIGTVGQRPWEAPFEGLEDSMTQVEVKAVVESEEIQGDEVV